MLIVRRRPNAMTHQTLRMTGLMLVMVLAWAATASRATAQGLTIGVIDQPDLGDAHLLAVPAGEGEAFAVVDGRGSGAHLRIIDAATLEVAHEIPLEGFGQRELAISADGQYVAVKVDRSTVNVYDARSGRQVATADVSRTHTTTTLISVLPGARALMTAQQGTEVKAAVVNLRDGRPMAEVPLPRFAVGGVAMSADGRQVAMITDDGGPARIEIWPVMARAPQASAEVQVEGTLRPLGVSWSPTGTSVAVLAAADEGATLWVVDAASGELQQTAALAEVQVPARFEGQSLIYIDDARRLIAAGRYVIDLEAGAVISDLATAGVGVPRQGLEGMIRLDDQRIVLRTGGRAGAKPWLVLSLDAQAIADAAPPAVEGEAGRWLTPLPTRLGSPASDSPAYQPVAMPDTAGMLRLPIALTASGQHAAGVALALHAEPARLVVGSGQGLQPRGENDVERATEVAWYDLTTSQAMASAELPPRRVVVGLHPSGERLLAAAREQEQVGRDVREARDLHAFDTLEIYSLADTSDHASGDSLARWRLFEAHDGQDSQASRNAGRWAAWPLDDVVVALVGDRLMGWSVSQQRGVWAIADVAAAPAVSHDGQALAVVSAGQPFIVDTATGQPMSLLQGGGSAADRLARHTASGSLASVELRPWAGFTPDGERLVASLDDGVHVYDLTRRTDTAIGRLEGLGHLDVGVAAEVLPVGDHLALMGGVLIDHNNPSVIYGYRPGGQWLIGGSDGRVWYLASERNHLSVCAARLPIHEDVVRANALHADPPPFNPSVKLTPRVGSGVAERAEVTRRLNRTLERMGRLGEGAVLDVSTTAERTGSTIEYRGHFGEGRSHNESEVRVIGTRRILVDGEELHKTTSQIWRTPRTIFLGEGQSIRDGIQESRSAAVTQWANGVSLPTFITADGEIIHRLERRVSADDHAPE